MVYTWWKKKRESCAFFILHLQLPSHEDIKLRAGLWFFWHPSLFYIYRMYRIYYIGRACIEDVICRKLLFIASIPPSPLRSPCSNCWSLWPFLHIFGGYILLGISPKTREAHKSLRYFLTLHGSGIMPMLYPMPLLKAQAACHPWS